MKISYVLQLKDFLLFLVIGFAIGILYEIFNSHKVIKSIYIIQIVIDTIFCLIFTIILFLSINCINCGEFRLFLVFAYYMGFILERIILGKLFAKITKYIYNKLITVGKKILSSKFGRFIFK